MVKIGNDKYYTPEWLVEYTINKAKEIIGEDNISEFLEPSAGDGRFLNHLPVDTLAYDLEPEDSRITKQDFLSLELDYKPNRCIIGNPPYGDGAGILFNRFSNKSFDLGDYAVFILPVSQLDNNYYIYKFDLIYSEDLGVVLFSNTHEIPVVLNIYKRPENSKLNKRGNIYKDEGVLKIVGIKRRNELIKQSKQELKLRNFGNYDLCIIGWGNLGKITKPFKHANVKIIKITDKENYDFIYNTIVNTNWVDIVNYKKESNINNPGLSNWHIYKHVITELHKAGLYHKEKKFLKGVIKDEKES